MDLQDVKVVNKRLADGTVKKYYYRRSTMTRIEGEPGTLLFKLNWQRAAGNQKEERPDEFGELIDRYKSSPEMASIRPKSQAKKIKYLDKIKAEFGHLSLAQIQDDTMAGEVYDWRDAMRHAPTSGDKAIGVLRQVLKWARKRRIISINQADDVDRLITPKERLRRSRSRIIWTQEWTQAFLARAKPWLADAYWLSYYTCAREGDVCALRWDMIKDGWLVFTPTKTEDTSGVTLKLPINELPPLKELLERLTPPDPSTLPAYRRKRIHPYILSAHYGKPLRPDRIYDGFSRILKEVMPGANLHYHDLRGTTITHLFNAGCTEAEVASISGHKIIKREEQEVSESLNSYVSPTQEMAINAYRKFYAYLRKLPETKAGN